MAHSEPPQPENGKFGRAALAIALIASTVLVVAIMAGFVLMITGHINRSLNYFIGTVILLCSLFQLMAIPVGVIGLFEDSRSKRPAWIAIAISSLFFVGTLAMVLTGVRGSDH